MEERKQKYSIPHSKNNVWHISHALSEIRSFEIYVYHNPPYELEFCFFKQYNNTFYIKFNSNRTAITEQISLKAEELGILALMKVQNFPFLESSKFELNSPKTEDFKKCILAIDAVIPLGKDIKERLYGYLGIKAITDMNAYVNELRSIFHEKGIDEALQKGLSSEESEPLWHLGQYCEKKQDWQSAIECYQSIVEMRDVEFSKKANRAIAEIITQAFNASDNAAARIAEAKAKGIALSNEESLAEILTAEQKRAYLNLQFSCILNINDPEDKPWLDRIFNELCGYKGQTVLIPNVKLDAQTLCAAAEAVYKEKQEKEILKKENSVLKSENEAYKARIQNQSKTAVALRAHGFLSSSKYFQKIYPKNSEPTRNRSFSC